MYTGKASNLKPMSGEAAQANILVLEVIINQCGMLTNIMFCVSIKELGKDIDEISEGGGSYSL